MTTELSRAVKTDKNAQAIVRQQLKATQDFLIDDCGRPAGKKFELMRLPYDLRHLVLEHLTPKQNIRVFLRNSRIPIRLPEAAHAGDKKLRRECLLVALNMCTIEIHSGPGNASLRNWLSKIDLTGIESFCETGFDAITSLTFPYFSRFPYGSPGITANNDVGLALACRNLRSMSMNFHSEELFRIASRHRAREAGFVTACALDIRTCYQLDGLLGASKLERVSFVAGGSKELLLGLEEVAAWFKKGFQERGQKVLIELC